MNMMIKAALIAVAALGTSATAQSSHYVSGHTTSNGTYVAPHYQTNPNTTTSDNWSTKGNTNPYTGQQGTKPDTRPAWGQPQTKTKSPWGN